MDEMNITKEAISEHLLGLSVDKSLQMAYDKLPPQSKAAFTRLYNKLHDSSAKKTGGKKGGKASAASDDKSDAEGDEEDAEEELDGLLTEE